MKWFSPTNRADSLRWRPKAADHPHPAERLGGPGVDLLALLADVAIERPEPPVPEPVGQDRPGSQGQGPEQEPPVTQARIDQAADELDDRPPGVVEHAEDQLADAAGVLAEQARRAPGLELVDPVQREPGRVLEDPPAGRRPAPACSPASPAIAPRGRWPSRPPRPRRPRRPARTAVLEGSPAPGASAGRPGRQWPCRAGRGRSPAWSPPGGPTSGSCRPRASTGPGRSTPGAPGGSGRARDRGGRSIGVESALLRPSLPSRLLLGRQVDGPCRSRTGSCCLALQGSPMFSSPLPDPRTPRPGRAPISCSHHNRDVDPRVSFLDNTSRRDLGLRSTGIRRSCDPERSRINAIVPSPHQRSTKIRSSRSRILPKFLYSSIAVSHRTCSHPISDQLDDHAATSGRAPTIAAGFLADEERLIHEGRGSPHSRSCEDQAKPRRPPRPRGA